MSVVLSEYSLSPYPLEDVELYKHKADEVATGTEWDIERADALEALGIAQLFQGNFRDAADSLQKSCSLKDEVANRSDEDDSSDNSSSLKANLWAGVSFYRLGDLSKALSYFTRVGEIAKNCGYNKQKESVVVASAKCNLAIVLLRMGGAQKDVMVTLVKEAIDIVEAVSAKDSNEYLNYVRAFISILMQAGDLNRAEALVEEHRFQDREKVLLRASLKYVGGNFEDACQILHQGSQGRYDKDYGNSGSAPPVQTEADSSVSTSSRMSRMLLASMSPSSSLARNITAATADYDKDAAAEPSNGGNGDDDQVDAHGRLCEAMIFYNLAIVILKLKSHSSVIASGTMEEKEATKSRLRIASLLKQLEAAGAGGSSSSSPLHLLHIAAVKLEACLSKLQRETVARTGHDYLSSLDYSDRSNNGSFDSVMTPSIVLSHIMASEAEATLLLTSLTTAKGAQIESGFPAVFGAAYSIDESVLIDEITRKFESAAVMGAAPPLLALSLLRRELNIKDDDDDDCDDDKEKDDDNNILIGAAPAGAGTDIVPNKEEEKRGGGGGGAEAENVTTTDNTEAAAAAANTTNDNNDGDEDKQAATATAAAEAVVAAAAADVTVAVDSATNSNRKASRKPSSVNKPKIDTKDSDRPQEVSGRDNADLALTKDIIESYKTLRLVAEGSDEVLAKAAESAVGALHRCGVPLSAKTGRLLQIEIEEPQRGEKQTEKDKKKNKKNKKHLTSLDDKNTSQLFADPTVGGTDIAYTAEKYDSVTVRSEVSLLGGMANNKHIGRTQTSLWVQWALSVSGGIGYGFMGLGVSDADVDLTGLPRVTAPKEKSDLLWETRSRLAEIEGILSQEYDQRRAMHLVVDLDVLRDRFMLNMVQAKVCAQLNLNRECGVSVNTMEAVLIDLQTYSKPPTVDPLFSAMTLKFKLDLEDWNVNFDVPIERRVQHLLTDLTHAKQYLTYAERAEDVQMQRDAIKRIINIYLECSASPMTRGEDPVGESPPEALIVLTVREIEEKERIDTLWIRKFGKLRALSYFKKLKGLAVPDKEYSGKVAAAVEYAVKMPTVWSLSEMQKITQDVVAVYAGGRGPSSAAATTATAAAATAATATNTSNTAGAARGHAPSTRNSFASSTPNNATAAATTATTGATSKAGGGARSRNVSLRSSASNSADFKASAAAAAALVGDALAEGEFLGVGTTGAAAGGHGTSSVNKGAGGAGNKRGSLTGVKSKKK